MKIICIIILSLMCLAPVYSQDGVWQYAWQSNGHNLCIPETITISTMNQTEGTVTYSYWWPVLRDFCPDRPQNDVSQKIIFNPSSKTWDDANGFPIVHNPETKSILLLMNGSSFWFQPEETGISREFIMGTLSGYWDYQESVDIDTAQSSCRPDRILLFSDYDWSRDYHPKFTYNEYYPTHSNCSENITNKALYIHGSNLTTISLVDDIVSPTINILFTPSDSSATLTLIKHVNSSYQLRFTFMRSTNLTPIQGRWTRDWQSNPEYHPFYSLETISQDNVQYIKSTYLNGCFLTNGFVVEVSPDNYFDPSLNKTFVYDLKTNTLRTETGLYSNASLFDTAPFVRQWEFSEVITANESCYLPKYVHITHNDQKTNLAYYPTGTSVITQQSNILNIAYVFPGDYMMNPIQNGVIETTISVLKPSISQVIWTDKFNNTISFADPTTTSQIIVNFSNQCSFTMVPLSSLASLLKQVLNW